VQMFNLSLSSMVKDVGFQIGSINKALPIKNDNTFASQYYYDFMSL
jgi:hypothetical protein